MVLSSVRVTKIKSRQQLYAMSAHALRQDNASKRRKREDATAGYSLASTTRTNAPPRLLKDDVEESQFSKDRDVIAAFDDHLIRYNAGVSAQGGYGLHAMISVSREWIEAAGGLHDTHNLRNRQLIKEAVRWVKSWAGEESVYAARLDLDETGGGNVDVFIAPIRIDSRNGKPTVSHSKPLTKIRVRRGQRMSYVALQDDWAEHCQRHLDPAIQRGVPKAKTTLQHLAVEEYKAAGEDVRRVFKAKRAQIETDARHVRELLAHMQDIVATADERMAMARIARDLDAIRPLRV
jgi:hypothetical protein